MLHIHHLSITILVLQSFDRIVRFLTVSKCVTSHMGCDVRGASIKTRKGIFSFFSCFSFSHSLLPPLLSAFPILPMMPHNSGNFFRWSCITVGGERTFLE